MNRKGIGLVELLGAVVIFGLVVSLTSLLISFILNGSNRIAEKSRANTEGSILISTIESKFRNFAPTDYQLCDGNNDCVIVESYFSYVLDQETETIILETYDPALTLTFEITDNTLFIDDVIINIKGFSLHEDSSIEVSTELNTVSIKFYFVLYSDEGRTYEFTTTKTYETQDVPQT